ncbi:MAG: Double zinc ribbon [Verrucomicrobiales bacterium]|nr:Double zinc ribbon [Verrucomicrobiales bacterium]
MKNCAYCGQENADDASACQECGTAEFNGPTAPSAPVQQTIEPLAEFPDPEPDISPEEESALCTYCVFPNSPEASSCKRCGASIGYPSIVGPVDAARASGFMWRGALRGRPKRFVLFSIWVLFLPLLIINSLSALSILFGAAGAVALPFFWLSLGFGAVSFTMLYRVTKNYFGGPII